MAVCGAVNAGAAAVGQTLTRGILEGPAHGSVTRRNCTAVVSSRRGLRSRHVFRCAVQNVCTFREDEGLGSGRRTIGWRSSHLMGDVCDGGKWGGLTFSSLRKEVGKGGGKVRMSLPSKSKNPAAESAKWSIRAIKSFSMAELEARKLKYPSTGTEALLMGILTEGTSLAAKFMRKNGVTLFGVRDSTVELLGKADPYFFSPEHPGLTEYAQNALDYGVELKLKLGNEGEVTTEHMLLGIWEQTGSAGQRILAKLGFSQDLAAQLLDVISQKAPAGAVKN